MECNPRTLSCSSVLMRLSDLTQLSMSADISAVNATWSALYLALSALYLACWALSLVLVSMSLFLEGEGEGGAYAAAGLGLGARGEMLTTLKAGLGGLGMGCSLGVPLRISVVGGGDGA